MDADTELEAALQRFADVVMRGERRLTATELAEESGVDLELARRLRRAMGLPDVPEDQVAFYQDDLDALRHADALIRDDRLDATEVLHLTRTIGLATARIADGVVGFWVDRFGEGPSEGVVRIDELADKQRIEDLERVVGYLLRRHLLDSVSRRLATARAAAGGGASIAVGFADLVGFSLLSEQLSDRETAELVERFEQTATDQIVGGGGRVIKMIGDEVMFSADPGDVGEIALTLAESFDSPDLPSVRVGVASGRVIAQSGDLYGPAVNLAARATVAARPGSVLISPSLADRYRGDERYRVVSLRPMRLKGIGVVPLSVLRRAGPTRRAG
jgi:adenylate cyclase